MKRKYKQNITEAQWKGCYKVIHNHSVMSHEVGNEMSRIPCEDIAIITPIQTAMIIELGKVFNQSIDKETAQSVLSEATVLLMGRGRLRVVSGWLPRVGNSISTTDVIKFTEAIGWIVVDRLFEDFSLGTRDTGRHSIIIY